jgi:hypothetical protein
MTDDPAPTRRQTMTKGERDDLIRLIKQRERVAKTVAQQRSEAMLADFERKIHEVHSFATSEIWKAAGQIAINALKEAAEKIDKEAEKLGVPPEFRPQLPEYLQVQTGQIKFDRRKEDMRRIAKAEIASVERLAFAAIEGASVQAQTEVLTTGMTSGAAIAFLEKLEPIETMMPELDVMKIQAKIAANARSVGRSLIVVADD